MATESEEVERVLQSLANESTQPDDGDADRDKVEELLRRIEQEKQGMPSYYVCYISLS